jgi:hypothetical protein
MALPYFKKIRGHPVFYAEHRRPTLKGCREGTFPGLIPYKTNPKGMLLWLCHNMAEP